MFKSFLKNIDRKSYYLAIAGIILSVAFGIFGIYTFYYEKRAEIKFRIIASYDVLDIKEPISGLKIIYQDNDLKAQSKNLKVFKLQVVNSGEVDILQNFFDNKVPWGFQVLNGKLVEAKVARATSQYLKNNFSSLDIRENSVIFPKVILERQEAIDIDILVIHHTSENISIKPTGKVAGISALPIESLDLKPNNESFLSRLFSGGIIINLIRYFLISVFSGLFLIWAILIYEKISAYFKKKRLSNREAKWERYGFSKLNPDIVRACKELFLSTQKPGAFKNILGAATMKEFFQSWHREALQSRHPPIRVSPNGRVGQNVFDNQWPASSLKLPIYGLILMGHIKQSRSGKMNIHPDLQRIIDTVIE